MIAEYVAPQPSRESIEQRVGDPDNVMDTYDRSLQAIRTQTFKFIRGSDGSTELFNVADDPHERHNVSAEHPDVTAEMSDDLDTWEQSFTQIEANDDNEVDESTQERLEDLGYI